MIKLINGDCLEEMKNIPDGSVDMVLTDPPYGTTACKWDSIIDLDLMWEQLKRIIKPNGVIALFGSEPFSSSLRISNIKQYKYDFIWNKTVASNFPHAKNMPLKRHEIVSIFSDGSIAHNGDKRMAYNPQGIVKVDKVRKRPKSYDSEHNIKRPSHKLVRNVKYENYPDTILRVGSVHNPEFHPTQKPVALMEYLIKTYTNEGETVLDFTMGSGTTGVAAKNLNRDFIGIELDETYFNIAKERII